jgi:hypothetical protein
MISENRKKRNADKGPLSVHGVVFDILVSGNSGPDGAATRRLTGGLQRLMTVLDFTELGLRKIPVRAKAPGMTISTQFPGVQGW